jgi:hypothetical protein
LLQNPRRSAADFAFLCKKILRFTQFDNKIREKERREPMHRENHSDPSQEYSFFPEFTELREMDQMVERLTYEER